MLQHLERPAAAVTEMVRVLRPHGRLVCCAPDWRTLTLTGLPPNLVALTARVLAAALPVCTAHPTLGSELPQLLRTCGLVEVATAEHSIEMRSRSEVEAVWPLEHIASVAARGGVPHEEAREWLAQMDAMGAAVQGSLTLHSACGVRSS